MQNIFLGSISDNSSFKNIRQLALEQVAASSFGKLLPVVATGIDLKSPIFWNYITQPLAKKKKNPPTSDYILGIHILLSEDYLLRIDKISTVSYQFVRINTLDGIKFRAALLSWH